MKRAYRDEINKNNKNKSIQRQNIKKIRKKKLRVETK